METYTIIEHWEFIHRRVVRAKQLIAAGLMETAQSKDGTIYLCRSQTDPTKIYVVQRENCSCPDRFYVDGRKLCKHILARLIVEQQIPLEKIGQDPCSWQRRRRREWHDERRAH